jgi:hypothetical protein
MFRRILIACCFLLAGISFIFPIPFYVLAYRPIIREYQAKYAEANALSRQAPLQQREAEERNARKGSARKALRGASVGTGAVMEVGWIAARYDVEITQQDADDFRDEVVDPLRPAMSATADTFAIQAGISMIVLLISLIVGNVAWWDSGILRGLLAGLLVGLVVGVGVGLLFFDSGGGWENRQNLEAFLAITAIVGGGGFVFGGMCGLVSRFCSRSNNAAKPAHT